MQEVLQVDPFRVQMALKEHMKRYDEAKYTAESIDSIVSRSDNLDPIQRQQLYDVLIKHQRLFSGLENRRLGIFPQRKFKVRLRPGATPYHCKQPIPIPITQRENFKNELQRQVDLGILERVYESEWGMPAFSVPKPDNTIRIVADLRELNKNVKQEV